MATPANASTNCTGGTLTGVGRVLKERNPAIRIVAVEPWTLARDPSQKNELEAFLYRLLEGVRLVAVLVSPVMPRASGRIFEGAAWKTIGERTTQGGTLHLIGLVSDGNVHSHIDQLLALIDASPDAVSIETLMEVAWKGALLGGGQLLNWGPHVIDHALQFLGTPPVKMWSNLAKVAAMGDAEDHVRILLENERGMVVDLEISGGRVISEPAYIVQGTRGSLSCSNLAHGFAACSERDKQALKLTESANIGIVNAYNDMLSAHQPFKDYPDRIKAAARAAGATADADARLGSPEEALTRGPRGRRLAAMGAPLSEGYSKPVPHPRPLVRAPAQSTATTRITNNTPGTKLSTADGNLRGGGDGAGKHIGQDHEECTCQG